MNEEIERLNRMDNLVARLRDMYYIDKECPVDAISCPELALECVVLEMVKDNLKK